MTVTEGTGKWWLCGRHEPWMLCAEGKSCSRCGTEEAPPRPRVVCLCGSTRFSEAFRHANLTETLAGRIVLTIGCDLRSDDALGLGPETKARLDDLHKRKIDLADEILVLNVGGYVGESTRSEIEYAVAHGRAVRWLEPSTEGAPPPTEPRVGRWTPPPGDPCGAERLGMYCALRPGHTGQHVAGSGFVWGDGTVRPPRDEVPR